ncbi:MAG: hypothetical protein ACOC1T_03695, partial [Halorhodospira sp.]
MSAATEPSAAVKPWERHTPRERLARFAAWLAAVAVTVWAATTLDIHWPFVLDAPEQMGDLADRMVP